MLVAIKRLIRSLKPFDRRKCVRLPLHTALECVCIYTHENQLTECQSFIKNISEDGMLITTGQDKVHVGKEVEIRCKLPDLSEGCSVHGKIVRTYKREYHNWHYSGIQFTNKAEKGIKLLLDFVNRNFV